MNNKRTILFTLLLMLAVSLSVNAQPITYAFHGGVFRYGTINLSNGAFTSLNFYPQGSNFYPLTADNIGVNEQLAIMSDFGYPATYYLSKVNFITQTADSIGIVGPLASGQNNIKAMAHNTLNDTWYVISGDDFGAAAVLYTLNINTGALTNVGTIQNATLPVAMAINCDGIAYIVNVVFGFSSTAVLNTLNLATAVATPIGSDLGLEDVSGFSQDMDFNPETGNLYWAGYWAAGFFSEGGSFRLINTSNGTSTEIGAFGQYETITSLSINANCPILPVELTSFAANVIDGVVELKWTTATEINNSGFEIERKSEKSGWTKIDFVAGSGSTTEITNYSFTDFSVKPGTYSYRLKQIDFNGNHEYSNIVNVDVTPVSNYLLSQNYPNPFNPSTKIRFSLPEASLVKLTVFNSIGEVVANLVSDIYEAGSHEVVFNASNLSSGIYFVRMQAGAFSDMKKINFLK